MDDGLSSWLIAISAIRERMVRDRAEAPSSPDELRWWWEGPLPNGLLDAVLVPPWGETPSSLKTRNEQKGSVSDASVR